MKINKFILILFFMMPLLVAKTSHSQDSAEDVLLSDDAKLVGRRTTIEEASEMSKEQQKVKQDLATKSYAYALAMRAKIAKEKTDEEKSFENKNMREIKDNELQPTLKSINLRLNSIVELQAILAGLNGVKVLNDAPSINALNKD